MQPMGGYRLLYFVQMNNCKNPVFKLIQKNDPLKIRYHLYSNDKICKSTIYF